TTCASTRRGRSSRAGSNGRLARSPSGTIAARNTMRSTTIVAFGGRCIALRWAGQEPAKEDGGKTEVGLRPVESTDEVELLRSIERWLEREVKPVVKQHDHDDLYPSKIVEQMKELGLFGATVSTEYGGLGLPARTYAQIVMQISSVWMAITGI